MRRRPGRRRGVVAIAVVVLALAGCAADDRADGPPPTDRPTVSSTPTTEPPEPDESITPAPAGSSTVPVRSGTGPAGTVPSSFAERPPYPSCGRDDSLSLDGVGPPSRERQCLLDANRKGAPAELAAAEVTALVGGAASVVYRTNPDRSLDVFVVGDPWQGIHCGGLVADPRRVFAPVDCELPIDL